MLGKNWQTLNLVKRPKMGLLKVWQMKLGQLSSGQMQEAIWQNCYRYTPVFSYLAYHRIGIIDTHTK